MCPSFTGGERSAGQQRQVTGVHDEAGVQVQGVYGDRKVTLEL